jgi:hypothetical protein
VAANHKAKDWLRREAYRLKHVKSLHLWRGSLIHDAIKQFVVPGLTTGAIDWDGIIERTTETAEVQFELSERTASKGGRLKDGGVSFLLLEHERGEKIPAPVLQNIIDEIALSLQNLASVSQSIPGLLGQRRYYAEHSCSYKYGEATLRIVPDLIIARNDDRHSIIEWKTETDSTRGPHGSQLALYAWVISDRWSLPLEALELVEVQLLGGHAVYHRLDENEIEKWQDFVYQSVQEIGALRNGETYDAKMIEEYEYANSPGTCFYCSFRRLCTEVKRDGASSQLF